MNASAGAANPSQLSEIINSSQVVAKEILAPTADETDRLRQFPRAAINELGNRRILGLMVPVEFGGAGGSLSEMATVLETLAQGCASTAMIVLMHYCASAALAGSASPKLKKLVLPAIARGEHLSTLAFSELGSGGHFYSPVSRAHSTNGHVELNVVKSFATSAGEADSYLVSTLNPAAKTSQELDIYFVEGTSKGLQPSSAFEGLGLAANASARLNLSNVVVQHEARLGEEKAGLGIMLKTVLPHFQIGSAAVSCGIARAALDLAISHATSRKYGHLDDSTLAQIPRVRFLIAEMTIELRAARAYLFHAIEKVISGQPDAVLDALAVKAKASEAALAVVSRAMTIGGGAAFGRRGGLERHFRDAQASAVMAPATDVLKDFIGKAAVGLPLF